jgi:uncharacterized protein YhhL (DUF1145 family)
MPTPTRTGDGLSAAQPRRGANKKPRSVAGLRDSVLRCLLEQETLLLHEFDWVFVRFDLIAPWVEQLQIFWTVRSAVSQRDDVIDMILLIQRFLAHRAATTLQFVNPLDVMLSVGPARILFARPS